MAKIRRILNRPGTARGRFWRRIYEVGYLGFKASVMLCTSPIFRVRRRNVPPRVDGKRVIFCPNHESYLDPAFLQMVLRRRVTFVMTNDFYKLRVGRWFFALVNAIPVSGGRLARTGLKRAIAMVKREQAICIFPEGRLSRDGTRGPGQRGIAVLARRTGAWIIPVGIVGSRRAWPHDAKVPRAARISVVFGDPLRWEGLTDKKPDRASERAFAAKIMARIEDALDSARCA